MYTPQTKTCLFPHEPRPVRGDPCLWGPRGLAFLLSAGRVLSQLSQYDCAASGVNSLQVAARAHIGVWPHCAGSEEEHIVFCPRVENLVFAY